MTTPVSVVGLLGLSCIVGCRLQQAAAAEPHDVPPATPQEDSNRTCPTGESRWLASIPRVPLAVVSEGAIQPLGAECCVPWRDPGIAWQGIDAWGQPLAEAHVSGADDYDASGCWELTLSPAPTEPALYVSGRWTPRPSAQWYPTDIEVEAFRVHEARLREMTESPDYHEPGYTKHRPPEPVFFQLPPSDDRHNPHPTKFAALGGTTLSIAYLADDGAWRLGALINDTMSPVGPADAYTVVAVVDMDGDGFPEVIVRSDEGPAWNDIVLHIDNPYLRYAWSVAATGVLGGTI